jgi:hypothetical protein
MHRQHTKTHEVMRDLPDVDGKVLSLMVWRMNEA